MRKLKRRNRRLTQGLKDFGKRRFNVESLEPRRVLDSTVVFNEVMYHPETDQPEWIELHNQMSVDIDLSDWSFEGIQFQFPSGTRLEGGAYLVVSSDPVQLAAMHGLNTVHGPFEGRLSNGGETIRLRNAGGRIMDELAYHDDSPWPAAADGTGASLTKRDPQFGTEHANNWTASVELGGTPGTVNFPEFDPTPTVSSVVSGDADWRVLPLQSPEYPAGWMNADFNDSAWQLGEAVVFAGRFQELQLPGDGTLALDRESIHIENSSFEANTHSGIGVGSVNGWATLGTTGVNPSSDGNRPFWDNGAVPDDRHTAFIQGRGSLLQLVSGFEPGTDYVLDVYYNARACCGAEPQISISLGGSVIMPSTPVEPVGDSEPFHYASIPFTAAAESGQLLVRNVALTGDHTLLVDAISIRPATPELVNVANSSFEASAPIPADAGIFDGRQLAGWEYAGTGSFGVADASSPRADNGSIPDGRQVLFLAGIGQVSQTVTGLTPGVRYQLSYRANSMEAAANAATELKLNGQPVESPSAAGEIPAVGGDRAYELRRHQFTASTDTVEIELGQLTPEATLLVDQIALVEVNTPLVTETTLDADVYLFRHAFDFNGIPSNTELQLRHFLDDGAVVHLNGQELTRINMPAGAVATDTRAVEPILDPDWSSAINLSGDLLRRGENVLAVQVHRASESDVDMAWALDVTAIEQPVPPDEAAIPVTINEVSGSVDRTFHVELFNHGSSQINLASLKLTVDEADVFVPPGAISPGGTTSIFVENPVSDGDTVALFDRIGEQVLDATHARRQPQARVPDGIGPFWNVDSVSHQRPNEVQLETGIIINEVMYHALPSFADPGIPPSFSGVPIIELDDVWRYNDDGIGLPTGWQFNSHAEDDTWKEGPGLLGFETSRVIAPGIGTELTDTDSITFYFERDLELSEAQFASADAFQLQHVIDDGAIFYINGVEALRVNMPDGPVEPTTVAARSVNNAELSQRISIAKDFFQPGPNRISVELHQRASTSSDVLFGARLHVASITDPGTPARPFEESAEEWIEIYNRSDRTVDLSGWSLSEAVEFQFPPNTQLNPGEYLVVANDAGDLRSNYPTIRIAGNFQGQLRNSNERIQLRDRLGNVVDQVHYFDGGRWDDRADGGGSSLELLDPFADNSVAESWSASETRGAWHDYRFRFVASEPEGLNTPGAFDELILGLLDSGEVWLDDLQLIEAPDGAAISRLQNGDFESDAPGQVPEAWRWLGNHSPTQVVVDPADPTNQVMKLVATGPTEHMSNHGETTLADDASIVEGEIYELSFRARWVNGSPQLNSRLYFGHGAQTIILKTNPQAGTPGSANSHGLTNLGPSLVDLQHAPVVPEENEPVTVSIAAADVDGLANVRLHYAVDRDPFQTIEMTEDSDRYQAVIPGQESRTTVQFYVTAEDTRGAESQFPADGPSSRAMYPVESPLDRDVHTLRIVMTRADTSTLHSDWNVMSNQRLGATVIYNDREVFYDAGVRLRASGFGRRGSLAGFNVQFDPQQLFRGVHRTVAIDRGTVLSSGTGGGGVRGVPGASPHELLIYNIAHRAGGIAAMYDDVVYVDAPRSANTGLALLKMARYSDVFLDSQFENGSDGHLFKYELIYHSNSTIDRDPESVKRAPDAVIGTDISDLGPDADPYRFNFILKNNRSQDNFDGIIALGQAFSASGDQRDRETQAVMDLDQWMRTFALLSLVGVADAYNMGLAHNLELYQRPDGKVLAFPWDVDHGFFYSTSANILGQGNSNLARVISLPHNRRLFHKHLLDIIQNAYNVETVAPWADHYTAITGNETSGFFISYVRNRAEFVLARLDRSAPAMPFEITTEQPVDDVVQDSSMVIEGRGWIDVHAIELENGQRLDVRWLDDERWQAAIPLQDGRQTVRVLAKNYRGQVVGQDSIEVTASVSDSPLRRYLRVTELMYHPSAPSEAEAALNPDWGENEFEFIELTNIASDVTLNLSGLRFVDGPSEPMVFPNGSLQIAPQSSAVLVSNTEAFQARYGRDIPIAGEYQGQLSNGGELLRFEDASQNLILEFQYSDELPWPEAADGSGASLELVQFDVPVTQLGDASSWRASERMGGTPANAPNVGDFDLDGALTAADIDLLCLAEPTALEFDLNGDQVVNHEDLLLLVADIFGTSIGDANLDGIFNSSDIVQVAQFFIQYEDDVPDNSTWATGDWNCDGEFTAADFVFALQFGEYTP